MYMQSWPTYKTRRRYRKLASQEVEVIPVQALLLLLALGLLFVRF